MYAKDNERKQGWQKFDQAIETNTLTTLYTEKEINYAFGQTGYTGDEFIDRDSLIETLIADGLLKDRRSQLKDKTFEEAAVALNASAAGTPWCTGASIDHARGQIKNGDFYIHYTDGKPDVAIRMDGTNNIGEIRGNSPNQALNQEQQQIATNFLQSKKFDGAAKYMAEFKTRAKLIKVAKGEEDVTVDDLFGKSVKRVVTASGKADYRVLAKQLNFRRINGYLRRDDAPDTVMEFFGQKYEAAAKKAYENNEFVFANVRFDTFSKTQTVDFAGKTYEINPATVKMLQGLDVSSYDPTDTPLVFPVLTRVATLSFFNGVVALPSAQQIDTITIFGSQERTSRIVLPANAAVKLIGGFGETRGGTVEGPLEVGRVVLRNESGGFTLALPNTKYVVIDEGMENTADQFANAAAKALENKIGEEDPDSSNTEDAKQIAKYVEPYLNAVEMMFGAEISSSSADLAYYMDRYLDDPRRSFRALVRAYTEAALKEAEYTRKAFADMATVIKNMAGVEVTIPDAKLIAPERVGDVAPVQALVEAPEVPVYAPKTYGIKDEGKGVFSFKSRRTPGEFDADPEPSAVDTFLGNVMGLAGRMQLVDKFAAVSQAFKTGMSKGVLTDVEAGNAEFLMRFGEHRSQYATQILTNGPLSLVTTKTDRGIEHTYKSTKGANPLEMAEALSKGKFANDSEAEGLLTLVTSGERAKQVGWEKLNYSDPAGAKAKYERALAHLEANPKQKDAIKEAMAIYQKFNNGLMDFLVQVGELTSAKAAELKAITYVPFYRVNANGEVQLMIDKERPVRIGNIKDEPQLQQLVGDNKQIMPIFASMVQNTFMLTNLGLRNQTVKETAFTLRKIGIASRIGQGPGPASPNIVRFKKNGEDLHVVIDTDMYGIPAKYIVEGMEGIKTTIPAVVRLLGIPADILRKFVTRAPPYAIRQTIRDPLNAWLTTGTDAFPVLSSFKELGSMVAGRSETERTLMESGAVSSNVFTGDERDMSKVLREITSGKAGWTKLLAKADAFALQGDTATRAVIYKDSIAKGMSHQQALLRSVESMNFSRRGLSPSIQMLSTMIPFFNAQIQGLDVLYRAFKGDMSYNEQLKIREKLFQRGMLLAIGTMAYAAAMQDDEAYKRAKPEERYGNWFVYVPGVSEPLRIPIPFELGYLFKALPEAVYNLAAGDEKASTAVKGIGKLLGQSNPFALPQAVKPLTEVVLGSSFFGGDIESEREKNVLATDRYRDSSTEISKLLGSVTGNVGLSPIKIDYLIRGYTGGLGLALVQLANPLLNTEAEAGVEKPSTKPSKIPFIGGLFQPVEGRGTLDSAYEKMLEIQQVKGTYNDLIEKGKRAEAQAFVQQYANQLALASTSGSVQKALGEMSKQERFIRNNPRLNTEQKDAALERLDKMKVAYARQFISLADRTTPR